MRKPTILLMNRVYPPVRGATGRILRDLARNLARDGWQVTVITSGPKAGTERDGAVRVIRVKGSANPSGVFSYALVWIKMLIAALKLPATQLVVTMTDPPMFAVAGDILCRVKKNKHMHWVQDVYPDLFPVIGVKFPDFLLDAMSKVTIGAMSRADKVIVIGRCMARHLSYSGLAPRKMAVVPNWPDLELGNEHIDGRFDDAANQEDFEKVIAASGRAMNYRTHQEQIKTGPRFRVLYAGNIGLVHPISVVLNAARILQNQNPEIEFLFVGDGPKYDAITRAKAQEHLDNVKLLPYQPPARLRALMESGDVHLVSLDLDAVGLCVPSKIYASVAAHRPCIYIGPTGSEASKLVEDYKLGMVIEPGNAEALADAIRGYRMDGDAWYAAHENAKKAAAVFVPRASIGAFMERAWQLVGGKPQEKIVERVDDLAAE
ncbi:MAG: glycosyltransferase family 4 protein [Alphaproteobacteria bacterium]|nr:glycosyltransferase family 4 protein [Alphaproteobacteria bacterium]